MKRLDKLEADISILNIAISNLNAEVELKGSVSWFKQFGNAEDFF